MADPRTTGANLTHRIDPDRVPGVHSIHAEPRFESDRLARHRATAFGASLAFSCAVTLSIPLPGTTE